MGRPGAGSVGDEMTEHGTDNYGAEYKRTSNDFRFRRLEQDNCICSVCHGTGAKIEFEYVTRNYASARCKGKICKSLQAHEHSIWICPACIDNLVNKSHGLVKILVKGGEQ